MDALNGFDLAQLPNFKIKFRPSMLNLRVGDEIVGLFSRPSCVKERARQPTMWTVATKSLLHKSCIPVRDECIGVAMMNWFPRSTPVNREYDSCIGLNSHTKGEPAFKMSVI